MYLCMYECDTYLCSICDNHIHSDTPSLLSSTSKKNFHTHTRTQILTKTTGFGSPLLPSLKKFDGMEEKHNDNNNINNTNSKSKDNKSPTSLTSPGKTLTSLPSLGTLSKDNPFQQFESYT